MQFDPCINFDVSNKTIYGQGFVCNDAQLDEIEQALVNDLLDNTGVCDLLKSMQSTDFDVDNLKICFESAQSRYFKDWQIGESLAKVFLENTKNCHFPWPVSRDLKNLNSSLTGCDLPGVKLIGVDDYVLAFAEVKTSSQEDSPPSVMTGLKKQMECLINNEDKTINQLMLYLGYRMNNDSHRGKAILAFANYLKHDKYAVYGILVRTTKPSDRDIKSYVRKLSEKCELEDVGIFALYVSRESLNKIKQAVKKS